MVVWYNNVLNKYVNSYRGKGVHSKLLVYWNFYHIQIYVRLFKQINISLNMEHWTYSFNQKKKKNIFIEMNTALTCFERYANLNVW